MARSKFTVDKVLDAVFDDGFDLSEGESSDKEDREELYAYLDDPVLRSEIEELTWDLVDEDEGDLDDFSDDGNAVFSYTDIQEPLGATTIHSDASNSSLHEA